MFATELIAKLAGGLLEMVNQLRLLRPGFGGVMVNHHPVGAIEPGLKRQVADPRGRLGHLAIAPAVVIPRLQAGRVGVQSFGQPLEQQPGH